MVGVTVGGVDRDLVASILQPNSSVNYQALGSANSEIWVDEEDTLLLEGLDGGRFRHDRGTGVPGGGVDKGEEEEEEKAVEELSWECPEVLPSIASAI